MTRAFRPAIAIFLLACGSSTSQEPQESASAGSGAAGDGGSGGGGAAGGEGGAEPSLPDAKQLKCGSEVCALPGQRCCYESLLPEGGADHCVAEAEPCGAPTRACDETADCAAGELCCAGTSVLPMGATVDGFSGTNCVDQASPASCLPEPGVGKSSVQVCKTDDECAGDLTCVADDCYGYPLSACGPNGNCGG